MRRAAQAEIMPGAQTTVNLDTHAEVLAAEGAAIRFSGIGKSMASSGGIAEFPRLILQVLFGNDVFRKIPTAHVARQNQLGLDFTLTLVARLSIRLELVLISVVTDNFAQAFI